MYRIASLIDDLVEVENLATFPADMLAVTGSRRLVSVVSSYNVLLLPDGNQLVTDI